LKLADWTESPKHARRFMNLKKSAGLIVADEHCYKRELHGLLANRDTFVELSS
jgi:hypothetical protein